MNQKIAQNETWGLKELEQRNAELIAQALRIWAYPQTDYEPALREFDFCTLDDEEADLTGRDIAKFGFQNIEQPVSSWSDMFEHVVRFLHERDKSVLFQLVSASEDATGLSNVFSSSQSRLRSALKVDEGLYVEKNTSTAYKITILRRLFTLYNVNPMDLVFYL